MRSTQQKMSMRRWRRVIPVRRRRVRYALLLKRRSKLADAQRILKDLLDGAKLAPAHYRRAQAQWLDRARRELG